MPSPSPLLLAFNDLPTDQAEHELLACCAATRWTSAVAARRPYPDLAAVLSAGDSALDDLGWPDVLEALDAHPRIGQRAAGGEREATWSRLEQSAAATEDQRVRAELVEANQEYERRFGHVFLICASGLLATEVLAALHSRLANTRVAERDVVRGELARIVRLRVARWLA